MMVFIPAERYRMRDDFKNNQIIDLNQNIADKPMLIIDQ